MLLPQATSDIAPFQAIGVSRLAHELEAGGAPVIHMEFGQPSTGAPAAAIARAHEVIDTQAMGYWESPALRARIARHYLETHGVTISPDQVIITCGASPALVLSLLAAFDAGDRIALARPGYVAYRNNLKALHMSPVEIGCGPDTGFQITAAALAGSVPAPRGVIIASPANPTGTVIPDAELEAIAGVCRARSIRIVSDEIYHGLTYEAPARSMLEFEPDAIIVNSFSKYFSMVGWRLGWIISPPDLVDRFRALIGNLFLTAPVMSQHAALIAMDCRDELDGHVEVYRTNRALMLEAMPRLGLKSIAPPDGAFYIYADISHLTDDSLAFCKRLLRETHVATAPGVDFDPVDGHHFIRFSFAVSTALVREALARLEPWFAAQVISD